MNRSRVGVGYWETVRTVWERERLTGFYKGVGPNLIRVLPGTVITFVVYEVGVWFFMWMCVYMFLFICFCLYVFVYMFLFLGWV
jgi:hypothetical protein